MQGVGPATFCKTARPVGHPCRQETRSISSSPRCRDCACSCCSAARCFVSRLSSSRRRKTRRRTPKARCGGHRCQALSPVPLNRRDCRHEGRNGKVEAPTGLRNRSRDAVHHLRACLASMAPRALKPFETSVASPGSDAKLFLRLSPSLLVQPVSGGYRRAFGTGERGPAARACAEPNRADACHPWW